MTPVAFLAVTLTVLPVGAQLVERVQLQPSTQTVLVRFGESTSLQHVLQEIGRQSGITVLFDESCRDQKTTVDLGTVPVEDALDKLTGIHRLFYKILDPKTIVVIPDNAQKHRQYDEMLLHTFYVQHGDVDAVANLFRIIAGIQRVLTDPAQKSITVRATADQIAVAESVLARNDAPSAEVSFHIEVLALDSIPAALTETAVPVEDITALKRDEGAEVLAVQTLRLTDNALGKVSFAESAPQEAEAQPTEEQTEAPGIRPVGLQVHLHPQVSQDRVRVSLELVATIHAAGGGPLSREVTTTLLMKPGELTAISTMSRVGELGSILGRGATEDERHLVVVLGVSRLDPGAARDVLPPLAIGTEERIRVP